jgi:hypothetical protein
MSGVAVCAVESYTILKKIVKLFLVLLVSLVITALIAAVAVAVTKNLRCTFQKAWCIYTKISKCPAPGYIRISYDVPDPKFLGTAK